MSILRFRSRFFILFFTFLVVICLTLLSIRPATAQEGEPAVSGDECSALDIVLMIDQSTSMGGAPGIAASDPDNFRIASVYAVINQLGDNRLYFCPDVIHRLGVISFGDNPDEGISAQIDLPFTEINPDPNADLEFWKSDRENLKAQIQPKDLGATDFASAFVTVKEMFDGLEPLGESARKRSIILLTDGSPCVMSLGCGDNFATGPYLDKLRSQIRQDFPASEGNNLSIWPIAMRTPSGTNYLNNFIGGEINQTLEQYWKSIAESYDGELKKLSQNEQEIPATFFEIITGLVGIANVKSLSCGTHYIEPYTERVIFTFFKNSPSLGVEMGIRLDDDTVVTLKDGESNPADLVTVSEYQPDEQIERYVIYKPSPGAWTITSDNCESVKIYQEIIVPQITLVGPTNPLLLYDVDPFYDASSLHYLTYEIRERSTAQPYPEHEQFPLILQVDITDPTGQTTTQTLSREAEATFRSTEPLRVGELGLYQVVLTGETISANPSSSGSLALFSGERASYTVYTEIRPFNFEILEPKANSVVPLNQPSGSETLPVPIKLRLSDDQGNSLDPERLFTGGSESWFTVTLTNPDGTKLNGSLTPDASEVGLLTGYIEGMTEGSYILDVARTGQYRQDRFVSQRERDSVPFTRVRTEYFKFKIVEPLSAEVHSLNEVGRGMDQPSPMTVKVQLVDINDGLLDPQVVFEDTSTPLLSAVLYGPQGTALETTDLQLDETAGKGNFIGHFQGQDIEGTYRIEIDMADVPIQPRYHLENREQSVDFTGVRTEAFDFRIVAPSSNEKLALHESGAGCVAGSQVYPSLTVELTQLGGEPLENPTDVLASATSAPVASLVAPDSTVEEIELELVETPEGPRLVGISKSIPDLSGEYRFEMPFKADTINPRFAPLELKRSVIFERSDSLLTNPWACRGGTGLAGFAFFALLALIGWSSVGGPVGTLSLIDPDSGDEITSLTLRPYPRVNKMSGQKLKELGVNKIRIWKAEPIYPDAPSAIKIEATDAYGNVFAEMQLDSGEGQQPFVMDAEILYR